MPDTSSYPLDYLLVFLAEIGYSNGKKPHDYANLNAWCAGTGVALSGKEMSLLVEFSQIYIAAVRQYIDDDDHSPPPYETDSDWSRRQQAMADRIRAHMMKLTVNQ